MGTCAGCAATACVWAWAADKKAVFSFVGAPKAQRFVVVVGPWMSRRASTAIPVRPGPTTPAPLRVREIDRELWRVPTRAIGPAVAGSGDNGDQPPFQCLDEAPPSSPATGGTPTRWSLKRTLSTGTSIT
jgi:hypothetical protein